MSWSELSRWWIDEINRDSSYEDVVTPLLFEVFSPRSDELYLDLGAGNGRIMRTMTELGISAVGIDLSEELVRISKAKIAVAKVPPIPIRHQAVDGVYSVLALEHIADHEAFFSEAARVTKPGGVMAVVINHPIWTAPESTPITDTDGEALWRPGEYFSTGSSEVPAGEHSVTFYHRNMSALLNGAADAGWMLEQMIEQPHHEYEDQAGIPRLLACRWCLLP